MTTAHTSAQTIPFATLPAVGSELADGLFAGVITTKSGTHAAVVLLADKPEEQLAWADAVKWAQEIGAELPTRPVAALLYANLKEHFEEDWHWTSEESSASYAWYCTFGYGYQFLTHKSYEGCVRAVRLIPLSA